MKLKKVKRSLHRRLATGLLVLVSMALPATLLATKVEQASIVSAAWQENGEIAPFTEGGENASPREIGAARRAGAGLFDVETKSEPALLNSDPGREASSTAAPAARFEPERKRSVGRRAAAGTLGGLRLLQRVFSNGQSPQ